MGKVADEVDGVDDYGVDVGNHVVRDDVDVVLMLLLFLVTR